MNWHISFIFGRITPTVLHDVTVHYVLCAIRTTSGPGTLESVM
jgi:hypothetical protein